MMEREHESGMGKVWLSRGYEKARARARERERERERERALSSDSAISRLRKTDDKFAAGSVRRKYYSETRT